MKIIPVIDLKDGVVVSAKKGQRDNYQPIKTPSSSIDDILQYFLAIYPFDTLYIADLNAITSTGNNQNLISNLTNNYKNINFWVDSGQKIQFLTEAPKNKNHKFVIGSESQNKIEPDKESSIIKNSILSLDFFPNKGFVGPKELLTNSTLWPNNIIIMSLACVGSNGGPDFKRLECFCQHYPNKNFIAAGGVRNEMDLLKLKNIGIHYTLIASALYSGAITGQTIKNLQAKKCPD